MPYVESPSPVWTRGPDIVPPTYHPSQHETWRRLTLLQHKLAPRFACAEYLRAREQLCINEERIPELRELDATLRQLTGWGIIRVEGYVQPHLFFPLLKQKLFPCCDLLRHHTELEYTSAPDMWHDIMGHLPMLLVPVFSEFYHVFGRIGVGLRSEEQLNVLDKVYWFSMEFGLINPAATASSAGPLASSRVYGAALVAAASEMLSSQSTRVERRPFSIEAVARMHTDVALKNEVLFEVPDFEMLLEQLLVWARGERLL